MALTGNVRRKREIERLVAEFAPACDAPALIEPLGPAACGVARPRNGWAALVESQASLVRHLERGDGRTQAPSAPDDWHEELIAALEVSSSDALPTRAADEHEVVAARSMPSGGDTPAPSTTPDHGDALARSLTDFGDTPARSIAGSENDEPATTTAPTATRPMRYRVQFTADQAYVDLLERARDLLWHQLPRGDLARLQRLALEALVEKLMRRKCGAVSPRSKGAAPQTDDGARSCTQEVQRTSDAAVSGDCSPQGPASDTSTAPARPAMTDRSSARGSSGDSAADSSAPARRDRLACNEVSAAPARFATDDTSAPAHRAPSSTVASPTAPAEARSASRHLPSAVRRGVWLRDGGRCAFRDARGVRCRATRALEFHHEQPFARGGPSSLDNVTLRCRAHNELAAEDDFGRELVAAMKYGGRRL